MQLLHIEEEGQTYCCSGPEILLWYNAVEGKDGYTINTAVDYQMCLCVFQLQRVVVPIWLTDVMGHAAILWRNIVEVHYTTMLTAVEG